MSASAPPRILTIMGSGETTPTMARVHRSVLDRLGERPKVAAALLDTPYGFQENAEDISERTLEYFRDTALLVVAVTRPTLFDEWPTWSESVEGLSLIHI